MWIRMIYWHDLKNQSGYTAWVRDREHFRGWLEQRKIRMENILRLWVDAGQGFKEETVNVEGVA